MNKWRQFIWRWRGVIAITPSVAAAVLLIRGVGLLQDWEWSAFDYYTQLCPPEASDSRVVIVGVDEADLAALNQPYISDRILAELLEKLKAQSPRAIGLDIYRDLPVAPGYEELTEVFKTTPNLVGIRKVVGESGRETVLPPPVLAELGQVGANDLVTDGDNTIRRGLLSVQDTDQNTVYSLSLYLSLLYLEAENIAPDMVDEERWWLGKTLFEPFSANAGGYVRAEDQGYQQIIRYRGGGRHFETVSLMDVLNERIPSNWASDRVVLIGAVGESSKDFFYTPYSSNPLSSLSVGMAGVEIHANLTSQIISAALEGRPLIKSWAEPIEWIWVLFWSGVGALIMWQFAQGKTRRLWRWQRESSLLVAIALLTLTTFIPFLYGWWLPVVPALLAAVGSATAVMAYLARSAGDIRRTFGRYLSDEIVTTLLENPEGQKLGGERRKITILTSDLRGFTATAERLPPETVIKVLNFYLGRMAEVIAQYHGTIDEFMGDGILTLFGAPICRSDDPNRAVACAVAMQLAMADINKTIKEWNLEPLEMGIGIHTGEVVVGNIGSEKRTKYGIVGSPVNLTYRIESFTTGGQILISEETRQATSAVNIRDQQTVKPKGIAQPITIYDVAGVGAPYHLSLIEEQENFVTLPTALPVELQLLDGKSIDDYSTKGSLVQLSDKGAVLKLDNTASVDLHPLSNLKLDIELNIGPDAKPIDAAAKKAESDKTNTFRKVTSGAYKQPTTEEIYAKVLNNIAPENDSESEPVSDLINDGSLANSRRLFHIRFTS
ncbi:MAG: adenylate/guanylate cyclase domain-containing protein, partial [Cyanobacteria bacterium J06649_4]